VFVFLQVFQINVQYCFVSHVAVGSCFVLSLIGSGGVLGARVYCNYKGSKIWDLFWVVIPCATPKPDAIVASEGL